MRARVMGAQVMGTQVMGTQGLAQLRRAKRGGQ